jgi:hypothetical protein
MRTQAILACASLRGCEKTVCATAQSGVDDGGVVTKIMALTVHLRRWCIIHNQSLRIMQLSFEAPTMLEPVDEKHWPMIPVSHCLVQLVQPADCCLFLDVT